MFWLDQFDLTRRWADRAPKWAIELAVALAMIAAGVIPPLLIQAERATVVPYALVYPAVLLATLLAGLRAGLLTLVVTQILVASLLLGGPDDDLISIAATTLAQLFIVLVVTAFRRASRRAAELEQRRAETLALALRELDHRTKNNFMLAAALLRIQASRAENPSVRAELEDASNRLLSIEAVQSNLAISSEDIGHVSLKAYVDDLCERLKHGLFDDRILLDCAIDDVSLPRDVAMPIGLIVNELITNALKHAFDDRGGVVSVRARREGERLILDVADNGRGREPGKAPGGVGTRLIKMLVMRINATMQTLPGPGTHYRIELPI